MKTFISIDIKLNTKTPYKINERTLDHHNKIISILFPGENYTRNEKSLLSTVAIDTEEIHYYIQVAINKILKKTIEDNFNRIDLSILDFSSNDQSEMREPFLIQMANKIVSDRMKLICSNYVMLLPGEGFLPEDSIFIKILRHHFKNNNSIKFIFINNKGDVRSNSEYNCNYLDKQNDVNGVNIKEELKIYFQKFENEKIEENLYKKCIRRLGHFRSYDSRGRPTCRSQSYLLVNCQSEILKLLNKKWEENNITCSLIVYDINTQPEYLRAIKAFSVSKGIDAVGIKEYLIRKNDEQYHNRVILLLVDVINTYYRLRKTLRGFENHNNLSPYIFTAIKKGKDKKQEFNNKTILSLITVPRPKEILIKHCEQCVKLKLPHQEDGSEKYIRIRAYDFFTMILQSGVKPERSEEKPWKLNNYKLVPDYKSVLYEHGGWIAYKFKEYMTANNIRDDIVLVRPHEVDSDLITTNMIQIGYNKHTIIGIPRTYINMAKKTTDMWKNLLEQNKDSSWVKQLESVQKQDCIIIDIFKGSDSTAESILTLLNYKGINCLGFYCLVDYNPNTEYFDGFKVPVFPLYKWNNPRT